MREVISELEGRLDEPTAKGLAHAVSRSIREGVLTSGDRLPPIRELARQLALSPTTVSAAWGLLTRAGTIRTAGRRGTVVADVHAPRESRYRQALDHQAAFATDLSTGVPDAALLPSLGAALRQVTSAGTPQSYLDNPVLPELREHLLTTWPYDAPALTVVDGAMDALELVIRSNLTYGDRVLVENPTFPPLLDLLESAGLVVDAVRVDDQGMVTTELEAAVATPVQAVFLQPRAHNPTGVSLTSSRLNALARVLRRTDALVVEDDSGSAISTSPDLSLGSVLPDRTVHIRSYSKSHGPDLRLAAMSGPEDLVAGVQRLRQLGQGWSSRLLQRLLLNLLTDPQAAAAVAHARDEYARRRARFAALLADQDVPTNGSDGLNLWVPVHDETAAIMRLAVSGVAVAPGRPFQLGEHRPPHIRVTVGLVAADTEPLAALVASAARTGPSALR
ncbi:MAG TPA: aminotransferase class I/II-fold pyridoxal phosphate-dependent enzyme [Marmoricola sp.]|nr:aminotransferase class I/II-fold pyridoxal phosphate-dependent enzyme [Marmoricola sp.]